MEFTVKISKKDITEGAPGNPSLCPMARAVRRKARQLGFRHSVTVRPMWIAVGDEEMPLPDRLRRWIEKFDDYWNEGKGKLPKPITFHFKGN